MPGTVFGRLTVIGAAPSKRNAPTKSHPQGMLKSMVMCRCACGTVGAFVTANLLAGNAKTCGRACPTKIRPPKVPKVRPDRSIPPGMRFGSLVVLGVGPRQPRPASSTSTYATSRCRCDCGDETVVLDFSLKAGDRVSCGCGMGARKRGRKPKSHGTEAMA